MTAITPGRVRLAPRVPRWQIARPALVTKIEQALDDGLVIVRGVAGGGKTAVVAEWAASTPREGTWVTVRGDSATRFSLWDHVLRSLEAARTTDGRRRLGMNTEAQLRLALEEVFGERLHTLVLDDYHLVQDRTIDDDIAWLVANTACSVVIVTRTTEVFESGGAQARLGVTVLYPHELAFDRQESASVLTADADLPDSFVDAVYDRLGGWPLATRTLALELRKTPDLPDIDEAVGALARVLEADGPGLPASLAERGFREAASRIALAEWVTPELARALAPGIDIEAILDQFETDGLGSWTRTAAGPTFTLQAFVRRTLLLPAHALPSTTRQAVGRAYATWADQNGYPAVAGAQALILKDWPLLARLAQTHFRSIMLTYRSEWGRILSAVPFDQLRRYPVLGAVMIQLLNADSGASAKMRALATLLINSLAPLRERGSTVDRVWRNSSALAAERISGRYAAAAKTSERIAALIDTLTIEEYESLAGILPVLHIHIATTRLYTDDLVGAVAPLREVLLSESDTQWSHLHARSLLALIAALRGDFPAVGKHTSAIENHITIPGWRGTYSAAGYHLSRALRFIELSDPTSARADLSLLDRHFDTIEHWPLILHVRALICLAEGTSASASAILPSQVRVRSRRSATSHHMRALLATTQADLLVVSGDIVSAEKVIAEADDLHDVTLRVAAARTALVKADAATALALTRNLVGEDGASPRLLADTLLIRSIAHQLSGHTSDSVSTFRQAMDVLEQFGLRLPLSLVPREPFNDLLDKLDASTAARAQEMLISTPGFLQTLTSPIKLTGRERAVLEELSRGGNTRSIAASLFVSPNTVKSQTRSLYRKLGVSTRPEALTAAQKRGLLERR